MKIESLQTFILHVPVTRGLIEDSTHKLFVPPARPGAGTTLKADALARYDVS